VLLVPTAVSVDIMWGSVIIAACRFRTRGSRTWLTLFSRSAPAPSWRGSSCRIHVRRGASRINLRVEILFRVMFFSGILLLLIGRAVIPAAAIGGLWLFALGMVIGWVGLLLRWWSFVSLGRYFTVVVRTSEDQPVVDRGPYRVLRHPSYTGLLLALAGGGLMWCSSRPHRPLPAWKDSSMRQRCPAIEPRRDPIDHLTKRVLPPTNVYPVKRGHRRGVLVPCKQGMLVRWPCSLPATRPPDSRLRAPATHITNYGRSTR
jgi:Isoprenylcysteine carboxyl methyltransferase (ICMT) family